MARALYRNPWVLFLDEVASVQDAEAESEINKVSDALGGPVTIALYAHRLSTVLSTDKVIYLDKGRVAVEGIFAALQKKSRISRTP